ncbi:hypothetical protein FH972_003243 [Carpinus fangiana]|uniref:Uncharacterized protein n=1 Tax=Carpinus fangiana TaxID=176857 RepID=A0A5N6QHC2_9ROSI|nr:hypothetical protein FH972_003243 [Carpinus fangiana]
MLGVTTTIRSKGRKREITSRPEWCEDEEDEEGLEEASSPPESATGIRSSRSLSLLAITIADFSSPIITRKATPCRRIQGAQRLNAYQVKREKEVPDEQRVLEISSSY